MSTIDRLEKLLAEATPGPWLCADHVGEPRAIVAIRKMNESLLALDRDGMAIVSKEADATAIVAAYNVLPRLLRVAKAAKALDGAVAECDGEFLMAKLHEALAALDAVTT